MRLIVDKTDNEGWYTFTPPKLVHFLVDIYMCSPHTRG